MTRVLELRQSRQTSTRRGTWINPGKYGHSEEADSNLDIWAALSNPLALRRGVATDYAASLAMDPAVSAVWLIRSHDDLHLAVILKDPDAEGNLRGLFIDMVCERMDPREGELFVFMEGESPDWVSYGEQLV